MRTQEEIWQNKPKFNKEKCAKCKYRGLGEGYYVKMKTKDGEEHYVKVYCNYTSIMKESCIKRKDPHNPFDVYDIRGDRKNHCKKFEEGEFQDILEEDANDN